MAEIIKIEIQPATQGCTAYQIGGTVLNVYGEPVTVTSIEVNISPENGLEYISIFADHGPYAVYHGAPYAVFYQ